MKKQLKLGKSSFTLLETLLSIVLLSFIVIGFSKIKHYKSLDEQYQTLNNAENYFNTKNYTKDFSQSNKELTLIINDSEVKQLLVRKHIFRKDSIELVRYELK